MTPAPPRSFTLYLRRLDREWYLKLTAAFQKLAEEQERRERQGVGMVLLKVEDE